MYAPDSIELLEHSGIDFGELARRGIDVDYFGELLITSGLVLFRDVKWISFHSCVPILLCPARLGLRLAQLTLPYRRRWSAAGTTLAT